MHNNDHKKHLPIQKCIAGIEVKSLSDIELLAITIGTATKGKNVINLAAQVYNYFQGLTGIYTCGIRELTKINGIGLKKAIKILAALEMGKRIISKESPNILLDSPGKIWRFFLSEIIGLKQEVFNILILNNKNLLLKKSIISIGTISQTIVHPREIFINAIRETGSAIIMVHNHPSGSLIPSDADINITKRISQAGEIIGIQLLDHIIVSERSYFSFRDEGYL